jgi:hypothetical protein
LFTVPPTSTSTRSRLRHGERAAVDDRITAR